jgi:hypothetical protein
MSWGATLPSVSTHATPVARKPHRCCECCRTIEVGERYHRVDGIWEGTADSFATCDRCERTREAVDVGVAYDERVPFGRLIEALDNNGGLPCSDDPVVLGHAAGLLYRLALQSAEEQERKLARLRAAGRVAA